VHLHPDILIRKLRFGAEQAPLMVIDNFVADAEALVQHAAAMRFVVSAPYFPGVRVEAPLPYAQLLVRELRETMFDWFQLKGEHFRFSMCHYSLITTPAANLSLIQRIPHVDSTDPNGLATVHYLFKANLGGTAFYRHRKTGFEYIDAARKAVYLKSLTDESGGPNMPAQRYIDGDTPLFERIAQEDGVFNRMIVYRRNSLHSGSIAPEFVPDPDPLTGRLSINSFIDVLSP
jgi:hypothetical protein